MQGVKQLQVVDDTTPALSAALPELPIKETTMIRLLRISGYALEDYFLNVFMDMDLTEKMYHVLCVLAASKNQQASPSELSELIGTSRANMTKLLVRLESQNFIEKKIVNIDGRRSHICLTSEGLATVERITPEIAPPVENAFKGLSEQEISTFNHLLRKFVDSLEQAKRM